jgi:hypothetical protein
MFVGSSMNIKYKMFGPITKIHYLEFRNSGIINATKPVGLEYEVHIAANEIWEMTKLLIRGTVTHIDMDAVLDDFFFGWETWSFRPCTFPCLCLFLSHDEKRKNINLMFC